MTNNSNHFTHDAWEVNTEVWDARMGDESNDLFKKRNNPSTVHLIDHLFVIRELMLRGDHFKTIRGYAYNCQRLALPAAGENKFRKRIASKARKQFQTTRLVPAVRCIKNFLAGLPRLVKADQAPITILE